MNFLDLDRFIEQHVTGRSRSLFKEDIRRNESLLKERIQGHSALVIGGAGTIGSSFIKALLKYEPARLFVVDINENGLTELTRDLRSGYGVNVPQDYKTYPMNIGHQVFEKMFLEEGPFDIVANFAAHKHVRSEKDPYSIQAMIENNVFYTRNLLELMLKRPPKRFFCVSTDKAANPVNVMGASKKIMEEVIMAYAGRIPVSTARFANVAFSNGSLPDGFLYRLSKKQPLSSPRDIRRYFVSPKESGELCLLACMLSGSGDIFFPKLAESEMKYFSDIAVNLLQSLGYAPEYCESETAAKLQATKLDQNSKQYPVYFFRSDTSGEKPFEEFYTAQENPDMDRLVKLGIIRGKPSMKQGDLDNLFEDLKALFLKENLSKSDLVELIKSYLPSFDHLETGRSLDQKM